MAIKTAKQVRRSPRLIAAVSKAASQHRTSLRPPTGILINAPSSFSRKATPSRIAKSARPTTEDPESNTSNASSPSVASKRQHRRTPKSYRGPEFYTHLPASPIRDTLAPNLLVLVIGLNPGVTTAMKGRAYSGPNNHFWRLLHESGLTTRRLFPEDDRDLPRLFAIGLTNIVTRPTNGLAQLSKAEMEAAVAGLVAKVRRWRPEVVIMDGKAQFKAVFKSRHGREPTAEECQYGWVDENENMGAGIPGVGEHAHEEPAHGVDYSGEWNGARIFIAPSTSGASPMFKGEREAGWRVVGKWVEQRRAERDAAAMTGN